MTRPLPKPPLDEFTARRALRGMTDDAASYNAAAVVKGWTPLPLIGFTTSAATVAEYLWWARGRPPIDDPLLDELVAAWMDWYGVEATA